MSREILEAAADRYNARRSAATGVEEGDDDDVLMVDGQQTAMMLLGFGIDGEYLFKHANAHARMLAEHRAVMEALVKRDAASATKRMQEHFRNGLEAAA